MGDGIRHGGEQLPVYRRLPGKVKNPGYAAHARHSLSMQQDHLKNDGREPRRPIIQGILPVF